MVSTETDILPSVSHENPETKADRQIPNNICV